METHKNPEQIPLGFEASVENNAPMESYVSPPSSEPEPRRPAGTNRHKDKPGGMTPEERKPEGSETEDSNELTGEALAKWKREDARGYH